MNDTSPLTDGTRLPQKEAYCAGYTQVARNTLQRKTNLGDWAIVSSIVAGLLGTATAGAGVALAVFVMLRQWVIVNEFIVALDQASEITMAFIVLGALLALIVPMFRRLLGLLCLPSAAILLTSAWSLGIFCMLTAWGLGALIAAALLLPAAGIIPGGFIASLVSHQWGPTVDIGVGTVIGILAGFGGVIAASTTAEESKAL